MPSPKLLGKVFLQSVNCRSKEAAASAPLPGPGACPGARGLGKSHQKSPGGGGPGFPGKKKWGLPELRSREVGEGCFPAAPRKCHLAEKQKSALAPAPGTLELLLGMRSAPCPAWGRSAPFPGACPVAPVVPPNFQGAS